MGQNSFSGYDSGDFGFSLGMGRWNYQFSSTVPISRDSDRGYSDNYGAGVNYNYDHKKIKFNSSYFYNESSLWYDQFSKRQTFLPDSTFFTHDTLNLNDFRGNHSVASRLETKIDSNHLIIAKVNLNLTHANNQSIRARWFSGTEGTLFNTLHTDDKNDNMSVRLSTTAIYRYKFKKKSRTFAASGTYNHQQSDGESHLFSLNRFFEANNFTEQIRQLNTEEPRSHEIKSSLLYTDALSKKLFIESFYNFRMGIKDKDSRITDGQNTIDSLSLFYKNDILFQRLGTSLRRAHNGTNASIVVALQDMDLTGAYAAQKREN